MSSKVPRQLGAEVFIGAMALAAMACFWFALTHWHSSDPLKFFCYLAVALLASFLKIKLPGINGTMSVNFLFILLGVLEMSFAETLVIGFAAFMVQSYWKSSKRLQPIHVIFNLSYLPVGTAAAYYIYQIVTTHGLHRTRSAGGARGSDHLFRGQYFCHGNHHPVDRGQAGSESLVGMLFLVLSLLPCRCGDCGFSQLS